jgi:hypothetical protein
MKILKYLVVILFASVLAWTVAYFGVFMSRGDSFTTEFYFSYFKLAWFSEGAGELVVFIWLCSLVLFLPFAAASIWFVRRKM